ncbi:MAG TPA: amino acid adenylation domain-containing protein [Herpetosiphonaceae bacterium]
MASVETSDLADAIAIIGMACRFPGASTIDQFWQNLRDGVSSITFFSDQELLDAGVDANLIQNPRYVKAAAVLDTIDQFDAAFFGFNPREADVTDPQHRLFLECTWQALEQAGYASGYLHDRTGVYAGVGMNAYLLQNVYHNREIVDAVGEFQVLIGNDKDFLPTRVSYKLDLKGPSFSVQTACSSSLVGVYLACQALLNYQCDMAVAGGVSIRIPHHVGYLHQDTSVLSPDGYCRAFDANAGGFVLGSGVGVVVLKRLEDALNDGDTIDAVIRGAALNNDGAAKVGYTAPSVTGQRDVIARALALAEVAPDTIGYVEAHGSATALGDPVEIAALTQAFRTGTQRTAFCAIGSVKTNIGHADTAAGIAGLIKTVLALKHAAIPPSLHCEEPNPQIDFASSPFYVNTRLREWTAERGPRRAGVSSFGIGGTNVHLVLEEAPPVPHSSSTQPWQLIPLSARTGAALEALSDDLLAHLERSPALELADVAYTLQCGRRSFSQRRFVICRDHADLEAALSSRDPQRVLTGESTAAARAVAFMIPGLGDHYQRMGQELYEYVPTFRSQVDRCAALLQPYLDRDLREILFPPAPPADPTLHDAAPAHTQGVDLRAMLGRGNHAAASGSSPLSQTIYAQPAQFVIAYALAQVWRSCGIQPQALIGYSLGEYVAATLAGVLSLEDALWLVAERAKLIQQLPAGAMLAVPLPEAELQPLLGPELAIGAVNGPSLCVLSGSVEQIDAVGRQLEAQGIICRRIQAAHAFHSGLMEPIAERFAEVVRRVDLKAPQIPYLSNVTGTWITAEQATDPDYWLRHLCGTVRFGDGIEHLLRDPDWMLLEVGPGYTLCSLASQHPASGQSVGRVILPSMRPVFEQRPDLAFLLNTVGRLWLAGAPIDWHALWQDQQRRRIPLPTYPFQRQRYWVEPQRPPEQGRAAEPTLTKHPDIADWFYVPAWKQRVPLPLPTDPAAVPAQRWLIFADERGCGERLAELLRQAQQHTILVRAGSTFSRSDDHSLTIEPQTSEHYDELCAALLAHPCESYRIVHLWGLGDQAGGASSVEQTRRVHSLGFLSLVSIAQALGRRAERSPTQIEIVSERMHDITGDEALAPASALLLGPCKVIPQEYPHITCRSIDVVPPPTAAALDLLAEQLLAECLAASPEPVVAYRGRHRWAQTFDALRLADEASAPPRLREHGVYLITGGLGSIGLILARQLAQTVRARLVLVGRSALPERAAWAAWLATHDDTDRTSQQLRAIQAIEALGGEVLALSADVADPTQMAQAVDQALARFGALHGVIHAAGVAGGGIIQLKSPAMVEQVFVPKVYGTLALAAALKDLPLDFWVLCSSINAITGAFGQVDYCAANAFLDVFAQQHSATSRVPTVAINWDTWQETGMAVTSVLPPELEALRAELLKNGIQPQEGVEAFMRIVQRPLPRIIVSTQSLDALLKHSYSLPALLARAAHLPERQASHPRPNLSVAYVAPRSDLEQTIARFWEELLGVDEVGIFDNFFELGGHSLLATQLLARLQAELHVSLPLQGLFQAPTVAELAVVIVQRTEHAPPAIDAAEMPTQVTPDIEHRYEPFPLTDIQQAYWIGRNADFDLGNVSIHGYLELESATLDLPRFNQALQRLIERHDMLRAIVLPDGQQQILPDVPAYQIAVLDLRGHSPDEIAATLEAIRDEMSHHVLPLERWPLFEFRATRLDETRIRIHISVDGMIADAWSANLLAQDMVVLYEQRESLLKPLAVSFRDYVLAERALRERQPYQNAVRYWKERLADLLPAPDLPLSKNPSALQQPRFHRLSTTLDAPTWLVLKQRAAQVDLTPAGLLLAVYAEVLAAWSAEKRFTINIPRFNRLPLHPAINDLVGQFASFTLLEVDATARESFRSRAARIQEQLWSDLEHSHVSGVWVLRELARLRGRTSGAVMPVVFTSMLYQGLQRGNDTLITMPEQLGTLVYMSSQTPQVWLDLQVAEHHGALVLDWDYVQGLFPDDLMPVMFEAYHALLHRLAAGDDTWQEPPALTPLHQLQQRAAINMTHAPIREALLQTLFAEQAAARPHAPAIISARRTLSYDELYRASNRLGRRLRALGARPDTLVAVCMEKGWEQIVAVMGILQAGAAYLPIDPAYPQERIWYLLDHGQVDLVLTQSWIDVGLAWPARVQRICVDADDRAALDDRPLEPIQRPDHLAYVLYTSGSTGQPKGVMIEQRNVINRVLDVNRRFGVGPDDRAIALTALQHDLSVYDIFGMLCAGGAIVMPAADQILDPVAWSRLIRREQITLWNSVPAFLEMFVDDLERDPDGAERLPASLRLIMLSGDWIPVSLPDRARALARQARVISLGGPTETTVWDICYPIDSVAPEWKTIPYGRPMTNAAYHVLDAHVQPCPTWVPGQLYIGGAGLARGYWRDAERTAASFIDHPESGERLYASGDRGRYLPDGTIEFMGRIDFQVKIRGYRIELGEIEAAIEQHPQVQAAAVVAVGETTTSRHLVAYVVPSAAQVGGDGLASELRAYLKARLPEYMLPSSFIFLDRLPLNRNGKLDRQALPKPEQHAHAAAVFVAPRTPTETRLAQIWAEVLQVERVGIHDSFFDLGGHSLSATQMMSAVRAAFQVELSLQTIFEGPTVAAMAAVIERSAQDDHDDAIQADIGIARDQAEHLLTNLDELSDEEVAHWLNTILK